jgi:hypothetical protein
MTKWSTLMNMIALTIFGACSIFLSPVFIILVVWVLTFLYGD